MTRSALSKVECDLRRLTLDEAYAIAGALGVTLDEMCAREPMTIKLQKIVA